MSTAATFTGTTPDELFAFVQEQSLKLKPFRRVVVSLEATHVVDLNRTELAFPGISYRSPLLEPLLRLTGASFDPATLHTLPPNPEGRKEFGCTARYPWAHDRIL